MPDYDYKPNSHKYKERQREESTEKKRVGKVVSGKAKLKKKNEVRKLADIFIAEDIHTVTNSLLMDILFPAFKKTIFDMITNGAEMLVYGETGRSRKHSDRGYTSYRDYAERSERRESRARTRFDYDDVSFEYRGDAEEVLDRMKDTLDEYGMVRVTDLYDMAGFTAPYTAERYGWTNLRDAEVRRTRDGDYVIRLPRAMAID